MQVRNPDIAIENIHRMISAVRPTRTSIHFASGPCGKGGYVTATSVLG